MLGIKNTLISLLVLTALMCSQSFAAIEMRMIEFWNDAESASQINVDHSPLQQILQKYVAPDHPSGISRFNYNAVSDSDLFKLQQYLDYLQLLEPRQLRSAEAKAYWVNLYNAATLNMVIQANRDRNVSKVRARGLPARLWRRDIVKVVQQDLSLDDILHGIIRPIYQDHRVHYALFFCTIGGPDMPTEVLDGENNDELLSKLETQYLQQSRAVRLENGELVLSEMFESFDTDFASNRFTLINYFKQHVPEPVAEAISSAVDIRYDYDWMLNAP